MDQLSRLAALDDVAREELADVLERMAQDAEDLLAHAILPYTSEMLRRRSATCNAAACELRSL